MSFDKIGEADELFVEVGVEVVRASRHGPVLQEVPRVEARQRCGRDLQRLHREQAAGGLPDGKVENAGKTVRDWVKVFKLQLEHNLHTELSPSDIIIEWMVRWAAMIV